MNIIIYGAGNGGKVLKETIELNGDKVAYFIDDHFDGMIDDIPVYKCEQPVMKTDGLIVAIADGRKRLKISASIRAFVLSVIHPQAYISPSAAVLGGCHIKAGAIIDHHSIINPCCIIDNNVTIPHHNIIHTGCHLAPGVSMGSSVIIKAYTVIGIGASIATGVTIGENCIVGVGEAVTQDIPDNSIFQGGRVSGQRKGI